MLHKLILLIIFLLKSWRMGHSDREGATSLPREKSNRSFATSKV